MTLKQAPKNKRPLVLNSEYKDGHWAELEKHIDFSKPVFVYRNLHTGTWSVRQGGKVRVHTDYILLRQVKFVVNQSGRARVLKDKRKNVHAFVRGLPTIPSVIDRLETECDLGEAHYNPYLYSTFVDHCGKELDSADFCDMMSGHNIITYKRFPYTQKMLPFVD